MRHVADELRRRRVAMHNLGPMIPAGRTAVFHEEVEHFMCPLLLIKINERADDTILIRRVIFPFDFAIAPFLEELVPLVECAVQLRLWNTSQLSTWIDCDRR